MSKSFIDTTILVNVSEKSEPNNTKARKHLIKNPPALLSDYAYRELLVGRVALLCNAHNKVVGSDNVIEVAMTFLSQSAFGRTPRAQAQEILMPLKLMFESKVAIAPSEAKREIAEALMTAANKLWRAAAKFPGANRIQPLPCLNDGSLALDSDGILRGPNDSFNCAKGTVCGAAQYMYSDRQSLRKMITALDSSNLSETLKAKGETRSRRKALKLLEARGPSAITRVNCRQLGDAYFAAMCPPGASLVTTNTEDFEPLCSALGKEVVTPL